MQPADYIAIVFGTITVVGGIIGWLLHKLDKVQAILEVKDQAIAALEKTVDTQSDNILMLKSSAEATNNLMKTLRIVVQGGETT